MECSLCTINGPHLRFSIRDYLKHLQLFHAHQPTFKLTCGIGGCSQTYTNMKTYSNHVYGVHDISNDLASAASLSEAPMASTDVSDNHGNSSFVDRENEAEYGISDNDDCNIEDVGCAEQPSVNHLQRSSALLLLGLKEKHKLPQSTVQSIVNGMTSLIQQHTDTLKSQVLM